MTREEEAAYKRAYRIANREKVIAQQRALYAARRDEINARDRARYAARREEMAARCAAWRASHPSATREYSRKHKAKRRGGQLCDHASCLAVGAARLVLMNSEHRCYLCGRPLVDGVDLEMDHVVPVIRGGLYCAENLRPACGPCNGRKGVKAA